MTARPCDLALVARFLEWQRKTQTTDSHMNWCGTATTKDLLSKDSSEPDDFTRVKDDVRWTKFRYNQHQYRAVVIHLMEMLMLTYQL